PWLRILVLATSTEMLLSAVSTVPRPVAGSKYRILPLTFLTGPLAAGAAFLAAATFGAPVAFAAAAFAAAAFAAAADFSVGTDQGYNRGRPIGPGGHAARRPARSPGNPGCARGR